MINTSTDTSPLIKLFCGIINEYSEIFISSRLVPLSYISIIRLSHCCWRFNSVITDNPSFSVTKKYSSVSVIVKFEKEN